MTDIILNKTLAFTIGDYLGVLEFVALFLLFTVSVKERIPSSGLFALLVSVIIGLSTHLYAPKLLIWGENNPGNTDLVRFVWYMGFAVIYYLGLFVIRKCNEWLNVHAGRMAKVILLVCFTKGILNLVTYLVIVVTGKHYLKMIYETGTIAINAVSGITCLCMVIAYTVGVYRHKAGKREKIWAI